MRTYTSHRTDARLTLTRSNSVTMVLAGITLALVLNSCGSSGQNSGAQTRTPGPDMTDTISAMNMAHFQALTSCDPTNLALNKATTASSYEGNFSAASAVDGAITTRWASLYTIAGADTQSIQINLGSVQQVCGVTLQWEAAYGKAFRIEVSTDAATWTRVYETSTGVGGTQGITLAAPVSGKYVRLTGIQRGTGYGYSLFEFKVYGQAGSITAPTTGWINAPNPVTGVVPSSNTPPNVYFHEFQAQCAVSRSNLPDDPIIYPGRPGASHSHTFMGNTTTNAGTTVASLQAGSTACSALGDKSAYWMPTVFNGDTPVQPIGTQTIYYKTGVRDYTSVRPFPTGLRFVVGNMAATAQEFITSPGAVEGWECGNSSHNADIPASCPSTPDVQLNIRYQAPSCWDGLHLDSPDHKSHMAYPVAGRCTASHPVAVPMLEFKMAFPVNGDMSKVRLASGRGYSFHYDFFNAWDPATLQAMVDRCIVAGRQCNSRGWDERYAESTAVLGRDFLLH